MPKSNGLALFRCPNIEIQGDLVQDRPIAQTTEEISGAEFHIKLRAVKRDAFCRGAHVVRVLGDCRRKSQRFGNSFDSQVACDGCFTASAFDLRDDELGFRKFGSIKKIFVFEVVLQPGSTGALEVGDFDAVDIDGEISGS